MKLLKRSENWQILSPEVLRQKYLELSGSPALFQAYPNADVVAFHEGFAVLDHERGTVTVWMEWETHELLGQKTAALVGYWRDREVSLTADVPTRLFWAHLYPVHSRVSTCDIRASLGTGFWHNTVGEALRRGKGVTLVDLNQGKKRVLIQSGFEADALTVLVYQTPEQNALRWLVVSES